MQSGLGDLDSLSLTKAHCEGRREFLCLQVSQPGLGGLERVGLRGAAWYSDKTEFVAKPDFQFLLCYSC
jgi:hypothetical protein